LHEIDLREGEGKMNMPGFTAEAVLGQLARTYGNSTSTYRYAGHDAPVELARLALFDARGYCYRDCVNECIGYGLDTPAHCANDCYLGCYEATPVVL
jgi:hypothetical protein